MNNARKHERIPKKTKTKIESEKSVTYSTTHNLSGGGMFVTTPDPGSPGTEIDLSLKMPDGNEIALRGIIRWSKAENGDERAGMGIEFTGLKPEEEKKIQSLLK